MSPLNVGLGIKSKKSETWSVRSIWYAIMILKLVGAMWQGTEVGSKVQEWPQLTVSKKMGPPCYNLKEFTFSKNKNELGRKFLPSL